MSRGNIFWGIVLLLGGVLLLLDNLGYFGNIEVWTLIWPLFLIALGVWLLIGAALRRNIKSEHVVIPLEGAQSARLRFQHGAGRIILSSSASSANLMEGDFGGGLDVSKRQSGSLLEVKMKMSGSIFPFDWSPGLYSLFRLLGTDGLIEGTIGTNYDYPDGRNDTIKFTSRSNPERNFSATLPGKWIPDAFYGPMASLMEAIQTNGEPLTSAKDNLGTLRAVEASYRSMREARSVSPSEIVA